MMGGVGMRASAAVPCSGGMRGGVGAGDTWLRRTFVVGRLTRRTAELKVARGMRWREPLGRAVGGGVARVSGSTVH
jgi:hypothetical protein